MIKISEIAKMTGYSISTVSRVLNNKGHFSDETVRKIREVVNSLNYRPNNIQEKLLSNNFTIAVYYPSRDAFIDNNPYSSNDILHLREALENRGNMVVFSATSEKPDRSSMPLRMIEDRKIDGAVVCGPFVEDEIVRNLISHKIPYIVTNGIDPSSGWNYVDCNNFMAAADTIEYLYGLGHREIGILGGPLKHLVSTNRLDGCKHAFKKHGLAFDESRFISGPFSFDNGYASARALLKNNKKLTAIFAFDDVIACGAIKAAQELGLRVPEDISVAGFDDIELAKHSTPALTTVKRYKSDLYKLISQLINDLISYNIEKVNIIFKTELVIRDSCRKMKI